MGSADMDDADELDFLADENEADGDAADPFPPWKILIVDDEEDVHTVTHLALEQFEFRARPARLLGAYSAKEAREVLRREADIALIFLDVVMETDHAGLDLVRFIRQELSNRAVRIILRTGQPGQLRETELVRRYEIDDYKQKTELTQPKLITAAVSALRAYDQIRGLEQIIDAVDELSRLRSKPEFAAGVLDHMHALFGAGGNGVVLTRPAGDQGPVVDTLRVVTAIGAYRANPGQPLSTVSLDPDIIARLEKVMAERQALHEGPCSVLRIPVNGEEITVFVEHSRPLDPAELARLELFAAKTAIGFRHIHETEQLVARDAPPAVS